MLAEERFSRRSDGLTDECLSGTMEEIHQERLRDGPCDAAATSVDHPMWWAPGANARLDEIRTRRKYPDVVRRRSALS
jgi:hypothetical protein